MKKITILEVRNRLIFNIDNAEEFAKFAENCEPDRYRLYWIKAKQTWMLRPSKTSKHLDTALFTGEDSKDLDKMLEEKFSKLSVQDVHIFKE